MNRIIDLKRSESKPYATKSDCYVMQQKNMNFDEYEKAITSIENQYVKDLLSDAVKNDKNNDFKRLYKKYSLKELEEEIISFKIRDRHFIRTPKVINILAACLLNFK